MTNFARVGVLILSPLLGACILGTVGNGPEADLQIGPQRLDDTGVFLGKDSAPVPSADRGSTQEASPEFSPDQQVDALVLADAAVETKGQTSDAGPSASDSRLCSDPEQPVYAWSLGPWSTCSKSCGEGQRKRSVRCLRCDGEPAEEAHCPTGRPVASKSCSDHSSCSYDYAAWSAWGLCSATQPCIKDRRRECLRSDGATVACERCGGACEEQQHCGCCDSNLATGGGLSGCNGQLRQLKERCLAEGCRWGGPGKCTIGGALANPGLYGAQTKCSR